MKLLQVASIALLSLTVIGCGDDEESEPAQKDNGTVNEAQAAQNATAVYNAAQTAIDSGDGQAAAFSLVGVGSSALGIVTPGTGSQQPMSTGQATSALGEGTCDCTANSCDFSDCGDANGFTITGTISWTDTTLDCDYSVGGTVQGNVYNFDVFCDLDYTPTSLDGQLKTAGGYELDANGQMVSVSWDVDMMFNAVTLPGPSGGSMDVAATVTTQGQTYSASNTVSF